MPTVYIPTWIVVDQELVQCFNQILIRERMHTHKQLWLRVESSVIPTGTAWVCSMQEWLGCKNGMDAW